MSKAVVSYVRVSTSRQGRSGLGLEAQREAIARFAKEQGYTVAGEYVEVESGKGAGPQYSANAARARRSGDRVSGAMPFSRDRTRRRKASGGGLTTRAARTSHRVATSWDATNVRPIARLMQDHAAISGV